MGRVIKFAKQADRKLEGLIPSVEPKLFYIAMTKEYTGYLSLDGYEFIDEIIEEIRESKNIHHMDEKRLLAAIWDDELFASCYYEIINRYFAYRNILILDPEIESEDGLLVAAICPLHEDPGRFNLHEFNSMIRLYNNIICPNCEEIALVNYLTPFRGDLVCEFCECIFNPHEWSPPHA